MKKTIVELDLKGYSDIARELEEHLSAEVVMKFNDQIQSMVDAGLKAVGVQRAQAVMATTGDGAILAFDQPETGHHFGQAVHSECRVHNHEKSVIQARRWFRIGIATGDLVLEETGTSRKMAGSVIARAVRLEAAGSIGEILIDADTYSALPKPLQACYGSRELISGKREEKFPAYRYVVVPHNLTGSTAKVAAEPAAPAKSPGLDFGKATSILREKIAFLQKERAVVTSAEQKFELLLRIREAEQHLSELETDSSKT